MRCRYAVLSLFLLPSCVFAQIKIGYVNPQTGPLAAVGKADEFILDQVREAIGEGIDINGVGVHPLVSLIVMMPLMFLLGLALQSGIFYRLVKAGAAAPLLITVTFGLSVILQNSLQLAFSADNQGLDAGVLETASWRVNDQLSIGMMLFITLLVAIAVLFALQLFLLAPNRAALSAPRRMTPPPQNLWASKEAYEVSVRDFSQSCLVW